jgi:hypothetical protein
MAYEDERRLVRANVLSIELKDGNGKLKGDHRVMT